MRSQSLVLQNRLWISYRISTGRFVQNPLEVDKAKNCPTTFPLRYNVYKPGCHRRKPLSLLIISDLSTELHWPYYYYYLCIPVFV